MLECDFELEQDERIKLHIKYRYKMAQIQFLEMQSRFNQVCDIILDKNPSLIREICKQIDAHHPQAEVDT